MGLFAALALIAGCPTRSPQPQTSDASAVEQAPRPRVVLFIGDGMGKAQEAIASRFAYGAPNALAMHSLPHHGEVLSASASGLVDSAAAATTMASGALTYNGRIGIDRDDNEVETIIELAKERGLATGLVTTTLLPHATPAAFAAHRPSRGQLRAIAEDYVFRTQPDVLLGGGSVYFEAGTDDVDLFAELQKRGYRIVSNRDELADTDADYSKLVGTFSASHLPYVSERADSDSIPSLVEMTTRALAVLEKNPLGFVLIVEAGRIDHAGHSNLLEDAIRETLEFDDTIAVVRDWAEDKNDVTLIVTADHETGGLELVSSAPQGELPQVSWRWKSHTNRRINIHASGVAGAIVDGALVDHRSVFAVMEAAIRRDSPALPSIALLPNGHSGELRYEAVSQTVPSDFGSRGRLDALRIDGNQQSVAVGLDGTFSFGDSAVAIFFDVDYGAASGARALTRRTSTSADVIDQFVDALVVSFDIPGFGADLVAVSVSGIESRLDNPIGKSGWRGLDSLGAPWPARTRGIAINYDDAMRSGPTRRLAVPRPHSGAEFGMRVADLYPDGIPAHAQLAVVALLTSADGGTVSNQALPPSPASGLISAAVVVDLDRNGDQRLDDDLRVSVLPWL